MDATRHRKLTTVRRLIAGYERSTRRGKLQLEMGQCHQRIGEEESQAGAHAGRLGYRPGGDRRAQLPIASSAPYILQQDYPG